MAIWSVYEVPMPLVVKSLNIMLIKNAKSCVNDNELLKMTPLDKHFVVSIKSGSEYMADHN